MMDLPHLTGDTSFPGVQNVNPYRFKNTFDYHRWDAGTILKLCNVNWSEDDGNVVKFKNDIARDEYFDNIPGESQTLESQARIMSDSSVKVPLPFDECSKYNYLMVDIKTATSDIRPIDYETLRHMSRFYFFVLDYEEIAPNTTQLYLSIDYWTTYINRIKIGNMVLERGHAPMKAAADVGTYLANPIANTDNLLVEDIDYGKGRLVKHGDFIPFGSGKKFVLMASTINPSMASTLPAAMYDFKGDISFADDVVSEEIVEGSGKDASLTTKYAATGLVTTPQMSAATSMTADDNYIFNGYTIYAFDAATLKESVEDNSLPKDLYPSDATKVDYLAWKYPQFIESVAAMYIVTEDMFYAGETIYIGGDGNLRCVVATGADNTLFDLKLDKSMFGYEEPYSDITKLYTSPYAVIEITDAYGNKKEIGTERISNMSVRDRVSIAYPVLKFEAFLTGIDSNKEGIFYDWMDLNGNEVAREISNDSFRDFSYWYDIPTFELFMSGYVHHALHSYNAENTIPQREDELSYGNAVRSDNVSLNNALRSAKASFDNANDSADTGYKNSDAAALAAYLNAQASAATTLSNANKNANLALTNTDASADMTLQNETASAEMTQSNSNAVAATTLGNATRSAKAAKDNADGSAATALENSTRSATASRDSSKASAETAKSNSNDAIVAENKNDNDSANNEYNNAINITNPAKYNIAHKNADTNYVNSSRIAVNDLNNNNKKAHAIQDNANGIAATELANAQSDANTSYSNAVRSANTAQTNANASATAEVTNVKNSGNTATKNNTLAIANALAITQNSNSTATTKTDYSNQLQIALNNWNSGLNEELAVVEGTQKAITTTISGMASTLGSAVSAAAVPTPASAGNVFGTATEAVANTANSVINLGIGLAEARMINENRTSQLGETNNNANDMVGLNTANATFNNTNNSNLSKQTVSNEVETANTNASNTSDTTKANATRDHDTSVSNADANKTTALNNADRDNKTAVANNERTYGTTMEIGVQNFGVLMGYHIEYEQPKAEAQADSNIGRTYSAAKFAADTTKDANDKVATANKTTTSNNINRTYKMKNDNNNRTYDTSIANADRSYNAAVDNATDTNTTTVANVKRTYDASMNNATDTNTTTLANVKRSYDTTISNATNSNTVTKANADRSNANAKEVASATNATALANAKRTYDAAIGNAGNTRDNSKEVAKRSNDATVANANDSRAIAVYNEQLSMQKNQEVKRLSNYDKRLDTPYTISHASGQADSDEFAWRGLSIQIKTERPSEYKRAGDMFLRYGYALHRNWDVKDLNVMKHFTYWKAEDVWLIGGVGVMEAAQQAIRDKMLDGVTVWSNPDEVGSVSIYENN